LGRQQCYEIHGRNVAGRSLRVLRRSKSSLLTNALPDSLAFAADSSRLIQAHAVGQIKTIVPFPAENRVEQSVTKC